MISRFRIRLMRSRPVLGVALLALLSACASVPLPNAPPLTAYERMAPSGGTLTKAKMRMDRVAGGLLISTESWPGIPTEK